MPGKYLVGINFQKVREDATAEGMHFPSEFRIIALFGSGSRSLRALETLATSALSRKKAQYFYFLSSP